MSDQGAGVTEPASFVAFRAMKDGMFEWAERLMDAVAALRAA